MLLERAVELAATPKAAPRAHALCNTDGACAARVRTGFERALADWPETEAADAVRSCIEVGLDEGWDSAIRRERQELVRLRSTPQARQKLEAFFAKSAKAPAKG